MPTEPDDQRPDVRPGLDLTKVRTVSLRDHLVRFGLGVVISVGAGVIGKAVGVRFGGVFLAFPAILPASLTLIQEKEGTRRADRSAVGAVLGGVGLVVFAATGEAGYGHLPPAAVTALMLLSWTAASAGLYAVLALLLPAACDRAND